MYQEEFEKKALEELAASIKEHGILQPLLVQKEKEIYTQLLSDPDTEVRGTVGELAEKYGVTTMLMTGFLDGINDSLITPNPIETMTADTEVSLAFDKEKLYNFLLMVFRGKGSSLYRSSHGGRI